MGTKQSISRFITPNFLESEVKKMNHGGAYIPVPQSLVGRKVEVMVMPKNKK